MLGEQSSPAHPTRALNMARMHSRDKGKSRSTKPVKKVKPSWVRYSAKETEQLVVKLAKTGKSSSEIGIILRDAYGIPDVKTITKKRINQIISDNKLGTKLPEDVTNLIRRHIAIMNHLESNKKDMGGKRGYQLTESKIRRLVKYYKEKGILPSGWNYDSKKAKLLIE